MQTIGNQWSLFWNGLTGLLGRILGDKIIVVAIIALATQIVTTLAPENSVQVERLGEIGTTLILTLLGVSLKEIVSTWANRPKTPQEALDAFTQQLEPQTVTNPGGGQTITVTVPPVVPVGEVLPNG